MTSPKNPEIEGVHRHVKDGVYGEEMPSHIPKPFSILLLSSVSAICVDQRGYCASFRSTSSLNRALPPSSPLCSEQDRLYLPYNRSNASQIHTGVQKDEFWGIDFRFELLVDLILRLHYSLRSVTLFGPGSDPLESRKCSVCMSPSRLPLGSHQE